MNKKELFETLRYEFEKIVNNSQLDTDNIKINAKGLTAYEAIGDTDRKDYPILTGKEVMLQAEYKGCFGQAFTSAPADFTGKLSDIINGSIVDNEYERALFIASLNAVMKYLGKTYGTIHCKNEGPEVCATEFINYLKCKYDNPKILQVGYQPALFAKLAQNFKMRIVDLNPENIDKEEHGIRVEDGTRFEEAANWADLILCTGSTICNGSIVDYINLDKEVVYYGTTLAGVAQILGFERLCFCSE